MVEIYYFKYNNIHYVFFGLIQHKSQYNNFTNITNIKMNISCQ